METKKESLSELRETRDMLQALLREKELLVTKLKEQNLLQTLDQHHYYTTDDFKHDISRDQQNDKDFTSHIEKFKAVNIFVNGIDFSLENVQRLDNGIKRYSIDGEAKLVKFQLAYTWNEAEERVSDIKVHFLEPLHQHELAARLNSCLRHNNLHHIITSIVTYAELSLQRETVLQNLNLKYERNITTQKLETEGCYNVEVKNTNGDYYFEATWLIVWFPTRGHMDHSFNIRTTHEAGEHATQQQPLFVQLANEQNLTAEQIMGAFSQLVEAWEDLE